MFRGTFRSHFVTRRRAVLFAEPFWFSFWVTTPMGKRLLSGVSGQWVTVEAGVPIGEWG